MKALPAELTTLVNEVTRIWGETVRQEGGEILYRKVEALRVRLKKFRYQKSDAQSSRLLESLFKGLAKYPAKDIQDISHSFSVLLQLINVCENAFRSQRIREKSLHAKRALSAKEQEVYLVLTAHPTESRSPEILKTLQKVQTLILANLGEGSFGREERMRSLFVQLWNLRLARSERPAVRDEAEFIYSNLFRDEIIETLLEDERRQIFIRTWVGGDKDGHPGVDHKVMLESLQLSRHFILKQIVKLMTEAEKELSLSLDHVRHLSSLVVARHLRDLTKLKKEVLDLKILKSRDGHRVAQLKKKLTRWSEALTPSLRRSLYSVSRLQKLMQIFPAFVVPLELRESSDVLREGLENPQRLAIFHMLKKIKDLCGNEDPRHYASGFIVSMTETLEDMQNAEFIASQALLGRLAIPIVPLFEKVEDLRSGPRIVEEWLRLHKLKKFEIMLGYSDSSKAAGVLSSRLQIRQAMYEFEILAKKHRGLQLTYFHGSGGSVDRGGGRLEDQCAHWPASAVDRYKVTIQGEMVPRTFSTPEILRQYLRKVHQLQSTVKNRATLRTDSVLDIFSSKISSFYVHSIENPDFLKMVEEGSAYRFLENLYIGSRPSKRKKLEGIDSLRAIPWILGWTQTRILLPVWWGFGTAFSQMNATEQRHLIRLAGGEDPLFTSYIHQLNFTMAKVESSIWYMYLQKSDLSATEKKKFIELFRTELKLTQKALNRIGKKATNTQIEPWLQESIRLRSPLIHPLNVAQLLAWEHHQWSLLRETAVGIAGGMLTTG